MKKRILSIIMVLSMCLSMLPTAALAAEVAEVACTCETKCTENAINPDCPVCAAEGADLTACTGEETAPVCDCGTDDALIHATNCPVYVAPENPECFCGEKCTEDNINVWCDVCGFDYTKCGGTDTAAVYAEGAVASVTVGETTTYYLTADDLQTAVVNNSADQTVTLLADFAIISELYFNADGTENILDLNGHTLTCDDRISVSNCKLTVTGTDSSKILFTGANSSSTGLSNMMSVDGENKDSTIVVGSVVIQNGILRSVYGGVLDLTNATIPEAGLNVILYTDDWKSATYNVSDVLLLPADYYFFVDGKVVSSYSVETVGTVLKHTEHSYTYTDNNDGTHDATCTACGSTGNEAHTPGENTTCTDNGDGTHSYTCACDTTVTEAHTMDVTTGKCVCEVDMAVAKVTLSSGETTYYTSIIDAVAGANGSGNATITLLQNTTTGKRLDITQSATLDLNGNTLSCATNFSNDYDTMVAVTTDGAKLTIIDSIGGGKLDGTGTTFVLYLGDPSRQGVVTFTSSAQISGGTVSGGVRMRSGTSMTVSGGTLENNAALATIEMYSETTLNVSGGEILNTVSNGDAISNMNGGTVIISGGTVNSSGDYARAIRTQNSGGVEISGGNIFGAQYDLSFGSDDTVELAGGTFPGGITIYGKTLNESLGNGFSYWAGNTMLTVAADAASITDKGDITIRATCNHSGNSNEVTDNGDGTHSFTCSACGSTVYEAHTPVYSANGNTITATCSANCGATGTATVTAESKTYNGQPAVVDYQCSGIVYSAEVTPNITKGGKYVAGEDLADAGDYTASITLGLGGDAATASVDFTIAKAEVSITAAPTPNTLTYTGEAHNLISQGEAAGGTMVYSLTENGDYAITIPKGTNAGDYTVWYYVLGDANHNDSAPDNVTVTIGKAPLTIKAKNQGITYGMSIFQGTENVIVTGLMSSDTLTGITLTSNGQNVGHWVITPSDATISGSADNYDITYETGTLTISTASATPNEGRIDVTNGHAGTYTFDLSELLPDLDSGKSYGAVSYEVTEVSLGSYFDSSTTLSSLVSGSTLTLPIQAVSSTEEKEVGTITVEITSGNYIFTEAAVIAVNATNKEVPQGAPTLTPASITYGQKLSAIALSGTMTDTQGKTVSGTFTWDAPDTTYSAGTHHATWTFTPSDTTAYLTVSHTSEITVNKATPTGSPKYTRITTSGKTLEDAGLTTEGGTFNVPGSVSWELAETTTVAANTAYKWIFTPEDTDNYTALTGTVTLYTVSSGGGGGGGYTPSTPSTPSTPPTQSVTVPISGDDNTIHVGASVSGDKATVDKVDLTALNTVIGDHVDTGTVTIDFSGLDSREPITTVEIPSDVVKQIAEAVNDPNNDAQSLEIILSDGTSIEFDAVALGEKAAQAGGLDITISIKPSKDLKPNAAQNAALKGRPAYDISVTSGGKHISDMGGKITVHAPYELKPGEKARGIVVWYVDDHGNRERCETSYDQQRKRVNWKTDHLSLYMIDYDEALAANPFTDVAEGKYYFDAVLWAVDEGITEGTTSTTFSPDAPCTRAQMATFLWRAADSPEPVGSSSPFTDVSADAYYAKAVQWAYEQEITSGTSATTFSPDADCTRAQMATFLWRNAGSPAPAGSTNPFTDVPADLYYTKAVQWAYEQEITGGTSATTFSPDHPCTRAQMVTFLYRHFVK